jgi:hypothetical protein
MHPFSIPWYQPWNSLLLSLLRRSLSHFLRLIVFEDIGPALIGLPLTPFRVMYRPCSTLWRMEAAKNLWKIITTSATATATAVRFLAPPVSVWELCGDWFHPVHAGFGFCTDFEDQGFIYLAGPGELGDMDVDWWALISTWRLGCTVDSCIAW